PACLLVCLSAEPDLHPLVLHDALPILDSMAKASVAAGADGLMIEVHNNPECALCDGAQSLKPKKYDDLIKEVSQIAKVVGKTLRSEEHTSELQSRFEVVCRLLLERNKY